MHERLLSVRVRHEFTIQYDRFYHKTTGTKKGETEKNNSRGPACHLISQLFLAARGEAEDLAPRPLSTPPHKKMIFTMNHRATQTRGKKEIIATAMGAHKEVLGNQPLAKNLTI
jgi:hypothetical protein